MVWDKCSISLHSASDGIFYTNNIITGSVILEFQSKRKVEKIGIKVLGTSEAQWSRFSPTVPYLKIYSEKVDTLCAIFDIFENINGKTIRPGVYTYQFHLFLQSDLPSSYEDSVAKIKYRVIVESKSKNGFRVFRKVFPFTVMNYVDVNDSEIDYKVPLIFEATKKICYGDFTLYLKTYRGFAPNQQLPIEAILENKKKMKVTKITVTLIQKLEYNVTSGYCNKEKRLCSTEFKAILGKSEENHRFCMDLPPIVPSTINLNNPMVNVSYVLEAKVTFRYHLSLYCEIPVIVTTVPVEHLDF